MLYTPKILLKLPENHEHVLVEDFNENFTKIDTEIAKITDEETGIEAKFKQHTENKENPHGVTKNQVGLGNLQNYEVATKAEAEAGTSASKYMTPEGTKQAIDKNLKPLDVKIIEHSVDSIAHITSQERTKWNAGLQPATYSATNTIMNIGGGYASRIFPTISWTGGGPELWETAMVVPEGGIWGVLEIEIAGYSASSGGARVLVEIGINAQATGPSTQFGLDFKILQMSSRFAANFYVDFEHRPEARTILVKVYKRTYNDLITLKLNLLLNTRGMTAFQMLQRFNGGSFYNSAAPTTAIQQDLFTSVSNGKTAVASAISDKGVYTSPVETFANMANNIRLIQAGAVQGSGSYQATTWGQYHLNCNISGLPFRPREIILIGNSTYGGATDQDLKFFWSERLGKSTMTYRPGDPGTNYQIGPAAVTVTANGFQIRFDTVVQKTTNSHFQFQYIAVP